MSRTPLISVVVVNWNGEAFLRGSLASLRDQSFRSFETIVVDNGSTDGSLGLIEREYPEVRLIKAGRNLGFAEANNMGIEAARAPFIATINNDTVLAPDFLGELASAAGASPEDVGMWAPKILSLEDRRTIDSVGGLRIYRDCLARGRGRLEPDAGLYDSSGETFIPSACAALYRKAMLDSIGAFDPDFFAYCEDTDLGLRARLAGWKAVSVPSAVIYHHYSATGGRYSSFKAYLVERNRLWVAVKNLPLTLLPGAFFFTLWRYAVQTYGILKGKGAAGRFVENASKGELALVLLKAYRDALLGLPAVIKKRHAVKKLKKTPDSEIRRWFREYGLNASEVALKD